MPSAPIALQLPEPDSLDLADSVALAAKIREACHRAGGVIGFDRYMEMALYTPALGYYSAARSRFGPQGDFVTAPELSPLFAACLARPIADVFDQLASRGVQRPAVLEVGAGSGVLAEGLIDALAALGTTPFDYCILERSAGARGFQRERLARFAERVRWLDDFPAQGLHGVVLANELLDAIPVRCFRIERGVPRELGVACEGDGFGWRAMPLPTGRDRKVWQGLVDAALPPDQMKFLAEGYRGEFAPARQAWVRSAAHALRSGLLLLLDYGYPRRELYHPQRLQGTVACHFRHRVHDDPFLWPGLQDLGSHVDFSAVVEAGVDSGLDLAGYTTQAHFLLDCGLLDALEAHRGDERSRVELTAQVHRLTLPAELGEAVKAIALSRGIEGPLRGFRGRDLSHRL